MKKPEKKKVFLELRSRVAFLTFFILSVFLLAPFAAFAQQRYPAEHWQKARCPEMLGWSAEKLQLAKEQFEKMGSATVVIVVDGTILDEWGDTSRHFRAHSMRKSLLNALYGIHVHEGHINLDATLEELGIDDNEPLTATEKQATIRHLLKGRSGIYLPALYLGGSLDNPPRGSHPPGTFFHYNNWDFNVLGTIFELETGTKVFQEFKKRIADPLQMEDFAVEDCSYFYGNHSDNINTRYPAYPFRISARDLARFGLLYLRNGQWRGQQIIPTEWIKESWTPYSVYFGERIRYGYANWKIYLKGRVLPGGIRLKDNIYWTSGVGVHRLYIVPWANLIVVHRINSDIPLQRPSGDEVDRLLALILDAKISDTGLALIKAAEDGNAELVEALLESGADITATDEIKRTALHYAANKKHTNIVKILLDNGANANATDILGHTPLFIPAYIGASDIVEELINADAEVEAISGITGQTPLMFAAAGIRAKVVEKLLEKGADVNTKGEAYNGTALMLAAITGNTDMVKVLLDKGADVNAMTVNGRTAMMIAEALGHTEVVKLLEDAGATKQTSVALLPLEAYIPPYVVADAKEKKPMSPQVAQAFLSRGAEIKVKDETALLVAAMQGDIAAVHALMDSGADVNVEHKDGWTALLLAAVNGHSQIVQALLDKGANAEAKEKLIGQTALIWAAKSGHLDTVKILLEGGANVNASDKYGGTGLTRAADRGHSEIVQILLKTGADIKAREKDGETALLEATSSNHIEIVQALLEAGANFNDKDTQGRTPLMLAAMNGKGDIVRALLEAGADINSRDNFGSTALDLAEAKEHKEIAELLQKAGAKKE